MARTVFDGFGRWLIVDRGELMTRRSERATQSNYTTQFERAAKAKRTTTSERATKSVSRLVNDCHTVWGFAAALGEDDVPERQAARQTSAARHVAAIVDAQPAAVSDQVVALRRAAAAGAAFCEICEKASEQS